MEAGSKFDAAEKRWRWRAAALSLVAGLTHVVASPVYFDQWIGYGAVIVTVGALQGIGAMALVAGPPHRFFYWAGIVVNGLVALLWVITRTIGIPFFGPAVGEVWPVGLPDLLATLLELAIIAHLFVLLVRFEELRQEPLVE